MSINSLSTINCLFNSVTVTKPQYVPLKDVNGLILWLDATDSQTIVSTGIGLQWSDKSGLNNHFNATTNAPNTQTTTINNKNVLSFIGNKYMTNTTISMGTNYSIFSVGYTPTKGYGRLLHGKPGGDGYLYFGSGVGVTDFATFFGNNGWNDGNTNTPAKSIASPCIMSVTNNGANNGAIPYINGTAQNSKNGTNGSFTGLVIGCQPPITHFWNGYVGEIIIFNSVLSTQDRQKIEGYLAWKWGLHTSLPLDHPYYNEVPVAPV